MKSFVRQLTNSLLSATPKPVVRYLLKSVWLQTGLQDELKFHVEPYRWDSSIPTRFDLKPEGEEKRRHLPGIRFNDEAFLAFLEELAVFAPEMNDLPRRQTPGTDFWFENGWYQDFDAAALYCLIRKLKPKRIIESGCGFSTRIMMVATQKNRDEGFPCVCTFIDPFLEITANERIGFKFEGEMIKKKIEDVPLPLFQQLEPGDFLFLDTSHILKLNSDCCYQQLEIIPSLNPGVYVHVHDIFSPYDYPREWIIEKHCSYAEQYGLECLLTDNSRLEVILPLNCLWMDHRQALAALLPSGTARLGGFWMKTTSA